MSAKKAVDQNNEAQLKGAVAAFEQILLAEPNDRLALETLGDTHEKMGELEKAAHYLARLADVVVIDGDEKAAAALHRKLTQLPSSPESASAVRKLKEFLDLKRSARPEWDRIAPRKNTDITKEVSLAWDLMQAEQLTQEEYSQIVQDLSETSTRRVDGPVTVLHALQDRRNPNLEKIVAYLARAGGKPLITLSDIDLQREFVMMLPPDIMLRRGAMVFGRIADELLVALLNPFDAELQEDVRKATDHRCHFFLATAADYDNALGNARKILDGN